jgi:Carboxypeptidase regulatory-like domain
VQAWKVEGDKQRMDEHSISISGGDITGLELVLLPPVKVSGRIAFEGSASLASGRSMAWLSSIAEGGRGFSVGEITKDNTFVLDNLLPGRYAISVTALAGDAYLKSAYLGTADVLRRGLKVGSTAPAETLELVVSPFGASVEGTVTKTDKPAVGAYVRVEMTNAGEGRQSADTETQTDQYGHFALYALPPGEYTFSVSEEQQSTGVQTIKVALDEG